MNSPQLSRTLAAVAWAIAASASHAADVTLSGDMHYNTDVVQISFNLVAPGAAAVWTDSWQSGVNFDPVIAVWAASANGYTLIDEEDDDDSFGPSQGSFDAGLGFVQLNAGRYLLTLAASPNFAASSSLADGFSLDGSAATLISEWNQPGYNINANDQKGTFWRVNLQGVTQATLVPEPSSWLMLALGLAGLATACRNRARR